MLRELYRQALATPALALGARELPVTAFRQAVVRELGAAGGDRFEAVIVQGTASPEPPSDAFGPCFERVKRSFPQFELGFDEPAHGRRLRGLVPGSAAAKAGLLEGDELVSVESAPLFPDQEAVVTVDRAGVRRVVRYFPASQTVLREGFEWRRSQRACAGADP